MNFDRLSFFMLPYAGIILVRFKELRKIRILSPILFTKLKEIGLPQHISFSKMISDLGAYVKIFNDQGNYPGR